MAVFNKCFFVLSSTVFVIKDIEGLIVSVVFNEKSIVAFFVVVFWGLIVVVLKGKMFELALVL